MGSDYLTCSLSVQLYTLYSYHHVWAASYLLACNSNNRLMCSELGRQKTAKMYYPCSSLCISLKLSWCYQTSKSNHQKPSQISKLKLTCADGSSTTIQIINYLTCKSLHYLKAWSVYRWAKDPLVLKFCKNFINLHAGWEWSISCGINQRNGLYSNYPHHGTHGPPTISHWRNISTKLCWNYPN